MRKFCVILMLLCLVFMSACSTKRKYFEPLSVENEINFSKKLSDDIIYTTLNSAVLDNGAIIDKSGKIYQPKFDENFYLLNIFDNKFIVAKLDGNLRILNENGDQIYAKKFKFPIISACVDGNLLAGLDSQNTIFVVDLSANTTLLEHKFAKSYAQDARIPAPRFMNSLIIFPTLDGKIAVVNKQTMQIIRNIVLSNEPFFNNVIFLEIVNERMYVANANRIFMVNPAFSSNIRTQIKEVKIYKNSVYLFKKDGQIVLCDLDLKQKAKIELPFAIFSNVLIKNDEIFVLEKTGYLIKLTLDLSDYKVYKLQKEVKNRSFASDLGLYYDDKFLEIN